MIELKNISKWYKTGTGRHVVLDDISLTFPGRESIGIVGRNGAGKSTLLYLWRLRKLTQGGGDHW